MKIRRIPKLKTKIMCWHKGGDCVIYSEFWSPMGFERPLMFIDIDDIIAGFNKHNKSAPTIEYMFSDYSLDDICVDVINRTYYETPSHSIHFS